MKYTILFAAAAAAASDAYGGYGAQSSSGPVEVSSSAPVYGSHTAQSFSTLAKVSSSTPIYGDYIHTASSSIKTYPASSKATPCSTSVGSNGYTTIAPGYGRSPVTVTSQYQPYPTCVATGSDGKSCDKWTDDKYVSTTMVDYNKKTVTVTKVQECITIYSEKKTITHTPTSTPSGYAAASGYGASATPSAGYKNATGTWYELYEKVYVVEYENLGKNILAGYSGSGLCNACDDKQPVTIKEYKHGRWTEEKTVFIYGKPQNEVKTYATPGVYTVPAKTVTVYPTATGKSSNPNVYTYPVKTVTITEYNQAYTCTYEVPKQTPSNAYLVTDTQTPSVNSYDYSTPSATPKEPENNYPSYGKGDTTSPAVATSTPCTESSLSTVKPSTSTSVYGQYGYGSSSSVVPSKPYSSMPAYGNYGYGSGSSSSSSAPSKASSTPCTKSSSSTVASTSSKPVYGNYGYSSSMPTPSTASMPAYGGFGSSSSTPSKLSSIPCSSSTAIASTSKPAEYAYPTPTPSPSTSAYYGNGPSSSVPSKPLSTTCETDKYPAATATPAYNNSYGGEAPKSTPTPTPVDSYPADASGGYGSTTEYGKTDAGYSKRGGMIERRKAVAAAHKAKRAILL